MKSKLLILTFLSILPGTGAPAQQMVSLAQCISGAREVHRLSGEAERYRMIGELNSGSIKSSHLPSADAGAGIVYNSDVPDLAATLSGIPVPGLADLIPRVPHTQYRITLEVNQLIYDGGAVKEMLKVNNAASLTNSQLAEIEIYTATGRVIAWYYAVLLLDRHSELLQTFIATAEARLAAIESAVAAGVLSPSDYDMAAAERLELVKRASENRNMAGSARKTLSEMTGLTISEHTVLSADMLPGNLPETITAENLCRPELDLFDLTANQLEAAENLAATSRRPKVYGFATAGYGNPPGNNFFRDAFEPYFVAGASVRWNIWDWNKSAREREILHVKREITQARKNDAAENIIRALETKSTEIENLENAIETGSDLADLRKRISASAASKFSNGTITAAEYIMHTAAEREAVIELEITRINLMKASAEYQFLCGIDTKQFTK